MHGDAGWEGTLPPYPRLLSTRALILSLRNKEGCSSLSSIPSASPSPWGVTKLLRQLVPMVTVLPLTPLWVMLRLLQIQSRSVPRAEGPEQEHVSEARGGASSAHTWAQRLPAHWGTPVYLYPPPASLPGRSMLLPSQGFTQFHHQLSALANQTHFSLFTPKIQLKF